MKAKDLLDTRRDESPLGPAGDRVAAVFATLTPLPNPDLEAMRLSGALVMGEITDPIPNALTLHFSDKSHAIVVTSALIDFYESVSKILFGATNMQRDGQVSKAAATMHDVVDDLRALFEAWTPDGIAQDCMAKIAQTPLSPSKIDAAEMLVTMALSFVLSHEFGHVLYYKPPRGKKPAPLLTTQQETQADATGFKNLLFASANEGRGPTRMSIAGAMVALRVLAVLGALGHKFGEGHPPPEERLQTVMTVTRSASSTNREFWSMTTIAYAFDEHLAHAGALATGTELPLTPDRALSRMVSILEEISKKHKPPSELLAGMSVDFAGFNAPSLDALAAMAAPLFPPEQPPTADPRQDALWNEMGSQLRAGIANFPDAAKAAFQKAFPAS